MSEKTICTSEELKTLLKKTVSEKRFIHSLGVAQTTEMLLKHYDCENYEKEWNGFSAGMFCGLVHDLAREISDEQLVEFCKKNKLEMEEEFFSFPVLLHGAVSAKQAEELVGDYPKSWYKAIEVHTVGDEKMDDLALALFVADFIEPSRIFLTDEQRKSYLENSSIEKCAYNVLCDMMKHWQTKENFQNARATYRMKEDLERKIRK